MTFTGPVTLTNEQFQTLLSRIRENASVAPAPAPAAPLSPDQQLADHMWSIDRPRARPPFDASTVLLADTASERYKSDLQRIVTAQVDAQLAAVRAAGQRP